MSPVQQRYERKAMVALALRQGGMTFREIRLLLGLSGPDAARNLVGRATRLRGKPPARQ